MEFHRRRKTAESTLTQAQVGPQNRAKYGADATSELLNDMPNSSCALSPSLLFACPHM